MDNHGRLEREDFDTPEQWQAVLDAELNLQYRRRAYRGGITLPELKAMAAPKSLVEMDGDGYYWAQIYIEETETVLDPCVVQVWTDPVTKKRQAAWLGLEQPFVVPNKWVWLAKLAPPERLEADLNG